MSDVTTELTDDGHQRQVKHDVNGVRMTRVARNTSDGMAWGPWVFEMPNPPTTSEPPKQPQEPFYRRRARVWAGQAAVIPGPVGVTPQGAPAQAVTIITGCPKCGKAFKKGLTMHVKHCKGLVK